MKINNKEVEMIDRKKLRSLQLQLDMANAKYTDKIIPIPMSEWPPLYNSFSIKPIEVYRNNRFIIQVYVENGDKTRISVNRTQLGRDGKWIDDISWDDLQEIKRSIGFGDQMAVEVYPRDKDLVNVDNMRHLWLIDNNTDLGWKK